MPSSDPHLRPYQFHALTWLLLAAYAAQRLSRANGQVTGTDGAVERVHVWKSYGLPEAMGVAGRSLSWRYGADRQRVVAVVLAWSFDCSMSLLLQAFP